MWARWPLACCAVVAACTGGDAPELYDWHADDRLSVALASGATKGHFSGDTGDILPVMVEKLAKGRPEVQNHYRGELARGDARCVALIDDLIARYASSRTGTLIIGNALGVLGLSEDPAAVAVVRRMLSHPAESVRSAATRAMVRLAEDEDYEALKSLMPTVSGEMQRVLVQAMGRADAGRLAVDLSQWVAADGDPALLILAARAVVSAGAGSRLSAGILDAERAADPSLRPYLGAALAAVGDAAGQSALDESLQSEDVYARTRGLEAAAQAGLTRRLIPIVTDDSSETLRVLAAGSVADLLPDAAAERALRAGMRDASPAVRQACMRGLLADGDPAACDQFIADLSGGPSELGPAFRAVRGLWAACPGLAHRARLVLIQGLEEMDDRSVREREPWLQALGQVPDRAGALWLLALARTEDGVRHKLTTHRWIVLQISNGGPAARAVLAERWATEGDAARRMDYLWGASLTREPDGLEFLIEVVLGEDVPDYERLYAAQCLTRLGESVRVAPLLKRACLSITDRDARPAFERLLWTWYG